VLEQVVTLKDADNTYSSSSWKGVRVFCNICDVHGSYKVVSMLFIAKAVLR